MTCESVVEQLALLLYGELAFTQEEAIEQHLTGCPDCRMRKGRLQQILALADTADLKPDHQLLADNRRLLRIRLTEERERAGSWRRIRQVLEAWPRLAGACALLISGFASGYLASRILMTRSTEPVYSQVRYVEPNGSGRVQIVLEETSRRTVSGRMDEEPIRQLLLTAARESSDPGVRVGTMDVLKESSDLADVRRALLYALQHDGSSGVRLKALEALRGLAGDSDVRRVLANVVLQDPDPAIRTEAIDLLMQKPESSTVGLLQGLMAREKNEYVRMRCEKALYEMNASTEIF